MFPIPYMKRLDKGKDRYPDEASLHLGVHMNHQFVLDEYEGEWWTILAFVKLSRGKA